MRNIDGVLTFNSDTHYFQWGGYSVKPVEVTEETIAWLRLIDSCPASPAVHEKSIAMTERLRQTLAVSLNVKAEEILLSDNTTNGHNLVGWGLDFRPGDAIVLSRHEHPANILPWYALAQRKGLKVIFLDGYQDDDQLMYQLEEVLDHHSVRAVALSHVSRNTGYRLPVHKAAEICREREIFFLVDGAQSFGNIPVDIRAIGCDAYSFCGHKWILGPQGTGGLWLSEKSMDRVAPSWVGSKSQVSYDMEGEFLWKPDMKRYEYGTRNFSLFAGWLKALELIGKMGWESYFTGIRETTEQWKRSLAGINPAIVLTPDAWEHSSGIIVLQFAGKDAGKFSDWLWERHRIVCSRMDAGEHMRICNHIANDDEERARLTALVTQFSTGSIDFG